LNASLNPLLGLELQITQTWEYNHIHNHHHDVEDCRHFTRKMRLSGYLSWPITSRIWTVFAYLHDLTDLQAPEMCFLNGDLYVCSKCYGKLCKVCFSCACKYVTLCMLCNFC
jgi:hypothetical protein